MRWVFGLLAVAFLAVGPGRWLVHLYYRTYDPYGLYYRLTVDLADAQGRPVGIDIVVGCGVRYASSIGGGSVVDVMGMDAAFYAWAIPDGHALSVRTSPAIAAVDTCTGRTTDNGGIPRDWLPFVIWYEEAGDLSHGLAYATQDAYASPRARLAFHGARVARATAAEYRAFKARGPANLLPRYLSDALLDSRRSQRMRTASDVTPAMAADPKQAWPYSDKLACRGVLRIPLPPAQRTELAGLRPAGAAKYWHPEGAALAAFTRRIRRKDVTYGGYFMRVPDTPAWSEKRPKVYPQTYDGNLDRLTPGTFADGSYHLETTIAPEDLGFMACGRPALAPIEEMVTHRQVQGSDIAKETCFVDGLQVGTRGGCFHVDPLAYEDADYALILTHEIMD